MTEHDLARELVSLIYEQRRAERHGRQRPANQVGSDHWRDSRGMLWHGDDDVIVLSDPATVGVLLGMLMERTRRITAWVNCERGTALLDVNMEDGERAPTLGEALALALLGMKETTDDQ